MPRAHPHGASFGGGRYRTFAVRPASLTLVAPQPKTRVRVETARAESSEKMPSTPSL
jgi:hypothetical protein